MLQKIKKFIIDNKLLNESDYNALAEKVVQSTPIFSANRDHLILSFILNGVLEPQIYFHLLEASKQNKSFKVEFYFEIQNQEFNEKQILSYLSYYFEHVVNKKSHFLKMFERDGFCFIDADVVHLKFDNALEKNQFEPYKNILVAILKAAGFGKNFDLNLNVSLKTAEVELHREQLKKSYEQQTEKVNQTKVTTKKNVENKISTKSVAQIKHIQTEETKVVIEGQIFSTNRRSGRNFTFYEFSVTDFSDSLFLTARVKENSNLSDEYLKEFANGDWVRVECSTEYNKWRQNELCGVVKKIQKIDVPKNYLRIDHAPVKKVEFAFHSKMTAFDGISNVEDYLKLSQNLNWHSVAITDTNGVQAYPEAALSAKTTNVIYGLDCYIADDTLPIVLNSQPLKLDDATYVVFDLETSGLFPWFDDIIEFGAVKLKNNKVIDRIDFFIKPKQPINDKTSSITKISNEMLEAGMDIKPALMKIQEWIGDSVIVAHNGIDFDFNFLQTKFIQYKMQPLKNVMIDTLRLSWAINDEYAYHSLGSIARKLSISYEEAIAHRADFDAAVLQDVFISFKTKLETKFKIDQIDQINTLLQNQSLKNHNRGNKTLIYAKTQQGIKAIYELVSKSLTTNYHKRPQLFWSDIAPFRDDLLIACSPNEGDVFKAALTFEDEILSKEISKYDFILVSPPDWNNHLFEGQDLTLKNAQEAIKRIVNSATTLNKLVVAASDAYYLHPWEHDYHKIMIYALGLGRKRHRFFNKRNLKQSGPMAHVRTTDEMIKAFSFLKDQALIDDVAFNNSNKVLQWFGSEPIKPLRSGLYAPKLEDADFNLETLAWRNAKKLYGDNLPPLIDERIKHELQSILSNGYGIVYWIAHLLVEESNKNGYLVGSRGSVGSSLVATLTGISEINPLPPHYLCSKCHYVEFNNSVDNGFDLPDKPCNRCDGTLKGNGHDIPFETFMGFKGNKVPDIDLNFSGDYQAQAHNYIRDLFGAKHTLRAGTISTMAEKTAFGHIRSYLEEMGIADQVRKTHADSLVQSIVGTKRTTGQHPGGIMVFPKEYDVTDFTPYNFPADDTNSDWMTTHFAFEFLHDSLLKLDILGHDDPTMLKMLRDITKIDPISIPHYDSKVMNLFSGLDSLKISSDAILGETTGAIGIPEFGTEFVRRMLNATKPQTFADLIRISGLSHGTDVWTNNAETLVKKGLSLREVIACRDDIMLYLKKHGVPDKDAFEIMERVRKGKSLTEPMEQMMVAKNIPRWYIDSCKQIKYMFPKAHAAAYVLMAWRIAWYKINQPLAYYATLFSIKLTEHDIRTCLLGKENVRQTLQELRTKANDPKTKSLIKKKDQDLMVTYEAYIEMMARGYKMCPIDLNLSQATKFSVVDEKIMPPFTTIEGLGEAAAESIINARNERAFSSIDDLAKRTKLNKTHIAQMREIHILNHLPEDDQLKLF